MNYSQFSEEDIDKFYELKHIDAYQKLENPEGWLKCSVCGVLPRKWCFNNGKYATCLCYKKYDIHPARAESIMSVHTRCNGNLKEYDSDDLRKAWNIFAKTGVIQNKLEEGRW